MSYFLLHPHGECVPFRVGIWSSNPQWKSGAGGLNICLQHLQYVSAFYMHGFCKSDVACLEHLTPSKGSGQASPELMRVTLYC